MSAGTVRATTRGGRSVLRSAAAVEAAALRSLGVGTTVPLTALGNPLARLLDLAPDLSVLDELLGRSADPSSVRRGSSTRPASAQRTPATPGTLASPAAAARRSESGRAAARPVPAPAPGAAAVARASAAAANGIRPVAGAEPGNGGASASPTTGNAAPASGPSRQQAGMTPPPRPAPPEPGPGEARAAGSTSALRRAARSGTRPAADNTGGTSPASRSARPGPATSSGRPASRPYEVAALEGGSAAELNRAVAPDAPAAGPAAGPAAATSPTSNLPVLAARDLSRGGLAELVARWQDGEPSHPEPAAFAAPSPAFTSLSGAAFERERPLRLGDEDRVELALAQILRREVERHGLEGGR